MIRSGLQSTTSAIEVGGAPNAVHPTVEGCGVGGGDWKDMMRSRKHSGVQTLRWSIPSTNQRERKAFGFQTAWQATWDWKGIDGSAQRVKIQRKMVITTFYTRLCNCTTVQGKTLLRWTR